MEVVSLLGLRDKCALTEDGSSGLCPVGFVCGTGIASNLCCQPVRPPVSRHLSVFDED